MTTYRLLPSGLYRRPWNFPRSTVGLQRVAGSTADRELGMLMRSLTLPRRHISMKLFFSLI